MKRRNFLTSLAGLLSLPFISKAEAKPKYNLAVDPPGTASEIVSLYDMPLPELVEAWNRACSDLFNPPTP